LKADSNPRYSRIDPYQGAVNAVAESMRNVAAVGAYPIALTDCLNYGNPEKPEQFHDFLEGVKGISEAATRLYLKGTEEPVPFISGNVSFYNESSTGRSVDPSAIVACLGKLDDFSTAITMKIKKEGSSLFIVGERYDELGGSVYYDTHEELGKNLPKIDFGIERKMIYAVTDAISQRLLLSCHDISDGGMITALAEMMLGGEADGRIGAEVQIDSKLSLWRYLFSESSGFIFEVEKDRDNEVKRIFDRYGLGITRLGYTRGNELILKSKDKSIILSTDELRQAWTNGFKEALK